MPNENATTIKVCECGYPIVFTFMYAGAEYLCLNCGEGYDFFGSGISLPVTVDLKTMYHYAEKKHDEIAKVWIGGGCFLHTCDKCNSHSEYHIDHATNKELELHEKAIEQLGDWVDNDNFIAESLGNGQKMAVPASDQLG